ncbi:MAG: sigma-70 family RNA polymerase sigma factor [Gammaproteobacteria bacterium]
MSTSLDDPFPGNGSEHADELLGFLRRRVKSSHDAADLRQEVYLRLYQVRKTGQVGSLRAYLYRIARNLLVDVRRQQTVERRLFDTDAAAAANESVLCPEPGPEAVATGAEELELLRGALAELQPALRDALLWYRLEGLTLREIGARLGVSESMASRYVNKALAHCELRLGMAE